MSEVIERLQEGEEYRFFEGRIIVVHPDREPKVIGPFGTIEILKPSKDPAIT